jgi:hypothetical protein
MWGSHFPELGPIWPFTKTLPTTQVGKHQHGSQGALDEVCLAQARPQGKIIMVDDANQ